MKRPMPPSDLLEHEWCEESLFEPAQEIYEWLHFYILNENSELFNEDHAHLIEHDGVAFLWCDSAFIKRGRRVLGQAELIQFKVSGWQKYRQEAQMIKWFGFLPKALITLDAHYCAECSDSEFMALVEHELYHLAQKEGQNGPMFDSLGRASLTMRSHDVEEFHGVVQRYGASPDVQKMVELANDGPTISRANIAHACGTCLLKLA